MKLLRGFFITRNSQLSLIQQVNQKLLCREDDSCYVGLVVQKARKQGTVISMGRGLVGSHNHMQAWILLSPEFANEEAYLQM